MLSTTLLAVIVILSSILTFFKWRYTYWTRRGVPFLLPRMFFGNIQNPLTRNISPAQEYKLFYNEIKSKGLKHAGVYSFSTPVYVPIDLEYIKSILTKDFHYFDERGRYYNEKDDPISAHLFNIGGSKWKELRKKFTPTFSGAKLKTMFDHLLHCGDALLNAAEKYCEINEPIEIKRFSENFTAEVIGLCVFGVQFNTFKNENSEVLVQMAKFLNGSLLESARMVITFSFPELSKFFRIPRYDTDATQFYTKFITDLVSHRESNNIRKNDFLQTLVDLKSGSTVEKCETNGLSTEQGQAITMQQLIAQAMIFLVAGYDAVASTVALALFELANNFDLQERLRCEVNNVVSKSGGKLSYDNIGELKYMDQVLSETLRKYPPLAILNRQSNTEYKIPESDIVLEKGTALIIPLLGLHYDSDYFPDPDKFDPERFSSENITNIKQFSYLPFGEGPKGCLGTRFGLLQTKVALSILLKNYTFSLNSKTVLPFKFELGILNTVKGGIWLNVKKILQ